MICWNLKDRALALEVYKYIKDLRAIVTNR